MVRFKILKFKHLRAASELQKKYNNGEVGVEEIMRFASELVQEWDFLDMETVGLRDEENKPIPPTKLMPGEVDELSNDQIDELLEAFTEQFSSMVAPIPKANA